MPDANGNPTPGELVSEVVKEEFRQSGKSEAKQITWMWIRFLSPVVAGLVALLVVAALNIPSYTAANTRLTDTLATMHPWQTNQNPAWSVYEEATTTTPNVYLQMDFLASTFLKRILDLGWTVEEVKILVRVGVPGPAAGDPRVNYYTWVGHTKAAPDEGGNLRFRVSQHNLPPTGPPDGTLTDGAQYQCEIHLVLATHDVSFYREFVITTDWYTYRAP